MKWIKDKYKLSLNEVSRMLETGDYSILKRSRVVPGWLARRQYRRFQVEFAELFNRDMINRLMDDDIYRLRLLNTTMNILPILYNGLLFKMGDYFLNKYKERYGKDYEGMQDLKIIIAEIEKLGTKLRAVETPIEVTEKAPSMNFEQVINYVEMVLEMPIPRDMKLYQFKEKFNAAVKRSKELEKMKEKYQK